MEDPRDDALQPKTPPSIDGSCSRALAKDPDKRWQDAGDFAREICGPRPDRTRTTVDAARSRVGRHCRHGRFPVTAAALILAAIGTSAVIWNRSRTPQSAIRIW